MGIEFIGPDRRVDADPAFLGPGQVGTDDVGAAVVMLLEHDRDRPLLFVECQGNGGIVIELVPVRQIARHAEDGALP